MTTQKGDRVFVHVLDWKDAVLCPAEAEAGREVGRALRHPHAIRFSADKDSFLLHLDPSALDPVDTIVVLELGW